MEWFNVLPSWAQTLIQVATLLVAVGAATLGYIKGKTRREPEEPALHREMDARTNKVIGAVINEGADIRREIEGVRELLEAHDRRSIEEVERVQRHVNELIRAVNDRLGFMRKD